MTYRPTPTMVLTIALLAAILLVITACGGGGDSQDGTQSIDPPHCQQQPSSDCV